MTHAQLDLLVRELLLARTEELSSPQLAAFVAGWSSALDLVARTDLTLPGASNELHQAIHRVVNEIRAAQRNALADPD
ncbi:MAG: hypothetical protein B7733_13340 [Myxococcales bacterium FL481]|nr:MAG: hypothetical protein B7733_13340 [Myxococcales bacterium FL481]